MRDNGGAPCCGATNWRCDAYTVGQYENCETCGHSKGCHYPACDTQVAVMV